MMILLELVIFFELTTAILATIYYKKYSQTFLKYFLYILWLIVAVEFGVWIVKQYSGTVFLNNFIYNVMFFILYIYCLTLYLKVIRTPKYKKWVLSFLVVFIISVTINFLWIQKLMVTSPFFAYTFILGAILLVISIALFFIETLNSEKVLYFKRYLMFWISVGLVLFYAPIIPYAISWAFFPDLHKSLNSLSIVFFTLNLMMYGCFSIGFIVSRKFTD